MDRRDILKTGMGTALGAITVAAAGASVITVAAAQPAPAPTPKPAVPQPAAPAAAAGEAAFRTESDSLGEVKAAADRLWGAQTQRSLEHFSIGADLMPREMITSYAILKKAAANANVAGQRLSEGRQKLIVQVCDEILAGQHADMFPLHVWMTGSGTQFNMNVNEVISNRCSQIAGTPLGSKTPVHPNDDVNMAQSSNDTFPSAMYIAAAVGVKQRLLPALQAMHDAIAVKAEQWNGIVKIGRTHMQDAVPITLGQEWSGYAGMLSDNIERLEDSLKAVYRLAIGGTAVGTGLNSTPDFPKASAAEIARLTGLPFITAPNKFTVQGAHDAMIHLSGTMRTLAVSLYKIANDIRLMSCGPRAGFAELMIPENEPGSSIMPGKVNPTQCEAMTMVAAQVMGQDVTSGIGGASGYLEMNVYKPVIIYGVTHSITLLTDTMTNFRRFLIEGTKPNEKKIAADVGESLMLVTALSPVIGYDKASKIAHYAADNDLKLRDAALKLGYVSEADFNRIVDPKKMVAPYVATK
jgi:fumarate hydratase class II